MEERGPLPSLLPPELQAEREGTKPSALARGGDGEEFGPKTVGRGCNLESNSNIDCVFQELLIRYDNNCYFYELT
jgi:hypothetical protein